MAALLDDYDWVPIDGAPGGRHRKPVTKLLLHSTEGPTIAGAVATYRKRLVPPHITLDPARSAALGRCVGAQHIGLDRSSEALWHVDDSGVIQVELVGYARETPGWSEAMLTAIARWVIVPILEAVPTIPLQTSVTWERYPDSWGRWPGRLSFAEWGAYTGILGHMHAPARTGTSDTNLHGDPGGLNVPRILTIARTLRQEDDMALAPVRIPDDDRVWALVPGHGFVPLDPSRTEALGKLGLLDAAAEAVTLDKATVALINAANTDRAEILKAVARDPRGVAQALDDDSLGEIATAVSDEIALRMKGV